MTLLIESILRSEPSKFFKLTLGIGLVLMVISSACSDRNRHGDGSVAYVSEVETRSVEVSTSASVLIIAGVETQVIGLSSVSVDPKFVVADPGEMVKLSAVAHGPDGELLSGIEHAWSIADPRAGTINNQGVFVAGLLPGEYPDSISVTSIQNTPAGIQYSSTFVSVKVVGVARLPRLATVVMIPNSAVLMNQQMYRMRAMGLDENGLVIPGVQFVWRVTDPQVGRINDIGYLTVHGNEGTYPDVVSVTAIWEGVRVTSRGDIRVIAESEVDDFLSVHALPQRFFLDPGDRMQFRAVALNGLGELAVGTVLRWSMENTSAGSIDGSGNFVAGSVPGVYTEAVRVEAMVPGEIGFATAVDYASVVIRQEKELGRLNNLSIVPQFVVSPVAGDLTLSVRARDDAGAPVHNVTVNWEVLDPRAGDVSQLGVFKSGSLPGRYSSAIRVHVEQTIGDEILYQSKEVDVVVTGDLTGAEISPSIAVVASGRTVHFSVSGWDQNEADLTGLVVIWGVSDDRVGKIDPFGNFTAGRVPGLYEGAIRARIVQKLPQQR